MSPSPDPMAALTAAILARTSGPACGRLQALACDLVDGTLPAPDRELAHGHLEHCPECRGLLAWLELSGPILRGFAEVNPGPGFTASVLRATRADLLPPRPPQDRLLVGWAKLMRRPRAALEAAYLATAAGLLITQVPLPETTRRAGSAFIAQAWTGSRGSITRVASQGQRWTRHALGVAPTRPPSQRESTWATLRARIALRLEQSWVDFQLAIQAAWNRIWPDPPAAQPRPTEPSAPPSRSAH